MWRILPHGWVVVKNRSSSSPRWHVPLAGEFLNLPLVAINEDKLADTSSSGSQPQRATRVSNLPANAMPIYLRDWWVCRGYRQCIPPTKSLVQGQFIGVGMSLFSGNKSPNYHHNWMTREKPGRSCQSFGWASDWADYAKGCNQDKKLITDCRP